MNKIPSTSSESTNSFKNSPRLALIGCGAIAESYYLPALAKFPHIMDNLILVDQDLNRAQKLAANFKVKKYLANYREILLEADGVIVAVPIHLHHPIAMEFLSRGIPVLCEKPLAENAGKAREMVDEAQRTVAGLATNYSQRLWPQFAKVKELTRTKELGEPLSIKYFAGEIFKWPTVSGFYFNSATSGRGILRDRGAHVLDHVCWWLGGKPKVVCSKNDSFGGSEAVAYVQFEYEKCKGEVKLSWLGSFPCKFFVEFEHGSIEGDVSYPQSVLLKIGSKPQERVNLNFESYTALGNKIITNFLQVVAGDEKPLIPASDVLASVLFTDECYAAATQFDMPWYETPEVIR